MKKNLKQVIAVLMIFVLAFAFAGCSKKKAPTDAATLLKANQEATEGKENYKFTMDGEMSMEMDVSALGEEAASMFGGGTLKIPIKMKMDGAVADKKTHITGNMSFSFFGMSQDTDMENYTDINNGEIYSKTSDTGWIKTSDDALKEAASGNFAAISGKLLEGIGDKAGFEKTDDKYILKLDAKDAGPAFSEVIGALMSESGLGSEAGLDLSALKFESGTITYEFDPETLLINRCTYDKFTMAMPSEMFGEIAEGLSANLVMDFVIDMTDYGKVTEAEVTVPDDVKAQATESDGAGGLMEEIEEDLGA